MRTISLVAALAVAWPLCAGCAGGRGPLTVDLNGKIIEIHDATTVEVPKGNESQFVLRENRLRVAGQEPIDVVAGSQRHSLYSTDTTINVNGSQYDMKPGQLIKITPEGITFPTASTPASTPEPAPAPDPTPGQ